MSVRRSDDLPSFDPAGTEAEAAIPARFRVEGELGLRADGTWTIRGAPITHPGIARYLQRQLRRTAEGRYWVVNGPQRAYVAIEDAPFLVTRVVAAEGGLRARLSDGSEEPLDLWTLTVDAADVLHAEVKRGEAGAPPGTAHRARFTREAVFQLEPFLVEHEGGVALRVGGRVVAIATESQS